ncbi:MAG: hypothetical protein SOY64_01520 [Pyramidobacter sp.]|uniref:sodium:solute symporter family transporter n=1 Tax=Pyramidobacter sp. TaxID=1943581 RepID=UPI002A83920A|nr:hypothetical protein [Pyramidobacter sp.]MDY4031733.1 hypothetical protein [Pyramidobacter sp.]
MIDLGGFSMSESTRLTMVAIFALYSLLIVGLGVYVKITSRRMKSDSLASFLTGGGGLGAFSIAMIAATNSMAGGTMVAAPGLTYAIGFSGGIIYYAGFLTAAFGLGAVGVKAAILKNRIGAVSFLDFFRLRFRSKAVVGALAVTSVVGLLFMACGQITAGAKMFAAITGSNQYYLGLFLIIAITVIYTSTGGVKSMAKVAVIQGMIMLTATFSIMIMLLYRNTEQFGSLAKAVEYMGTTYPKMLKADTAFTFLNALGTVIFVGIGLGTIPYALPVALTYDNHRTLKRGVMISCVIFTICQGLMCATGPWAHNLNPNLVVRDYTTFYVATNLLPSWVGGIIFCGVFAAIQSSLAGFCLSAAAFFAKDFYADCVKLDMSEKAQKTVSTLTVLGFATIATALALKPTDLTQYMINFAIGALASAWYWPVLMGLYWKKATRTGALWSCIGGFVAYMALYFVSAVIPATKAFWVTNLGNVQPFLPAWAISFAFMYFGSLATQNDRVPLGYFQVFFCNDYDEKYAKNFRLN